MSTKYQEILTTFLLAACMFVSACSTTPPNSKPGLLTIQEQGSFAVGGTVIANPGTFNPYKQTPEGQTFHGDHAYVFYQIPANARKLPLVLWHGFGQFSKTWETTPDGREGYQNIFLRRGFGVYVIDQPRRGNAGRSTQPITLTPVPDEQKWFNTFRVGIWPDFFPGVQFSHAPAALEQYFRQMTPDTGPIDIDVTSDAVAALFSKIGPAVLVTHSHSGGMGWRTAIKSQSVCAVVSYEPGSHFVFPEGEVPPPMQSSGVNGIAKAVTWLHENSSEPMKVEALAELANMRVSSFRQHFKAVTSMSPLQFQKTLRLQEARRLMLSTMTDAGTASWRVGYQSASQFSREYSRFFESAPTKDIARLRELTTLDLSHLGLCSPGLV
jgi:AraC-like DNA-binding protein